MEMKSLHSTNIVEHMSSNAAIQVQNATKKPRDTKLRQLRIIKWGEGDMDFGRRHEKRLGNLEFDR